MKLLNVTREDQHMIQKLELDILIELDRICKKYNIHYTVAYGTMIGTIRHNGFIPWDDDVDVCMLRKDYIKFKEVCKKELNKKYFYQSHDTDPEYYYLFDKIRLNDTVFRESFVSKYNIHHGVYIDIFPVDYITEDSLKRNIQYYKFHFYRTGVMVKYLMLSARTGKKKIIASLLRIPYCLFSLDYLYKKAHETAMKYDKSGHKKALNFFSPYKKREIFDSKVYKESIRHKFEGEDISISAYYDLMLTQIYGDYMQFPPKTQQNTRHTITELKI